MSVALANRNIAQANNNHILYVTGKQKIKSLNLQVATLAPGKYWVLGSDSELML